MKKKVLVMGVIGADVHAVGNRILTLNRVSFGRILLDPALERGQWRYLTDEETADFTALPASVQS